MSYFKVWIERFKVLTNTENTLFSVTCVDVALL